MADSKLRVIVEGRDDLSPQFKKIESGVIRFVGAVSASLAAIRIGAAPIIAAAQFERELANVAKTTGFVSKAVQGGIGDLDRMGEALRNISLRVGTSAVDLAKIAAAAGQQGLGRYGVAGVIQFTDSVSRMSNVLDLTAEESATALGKIVNIFRIPLIEIERTVSTINEITNRSTANGEELIDTIKRVGDAAGALTLEQTAALGATGLDFGLTPEVIGTAFNKVFSSFLEDADRYAKVVEGIALSTGEVLDGSATQWIETVKKNGFEALQVYLKGLRNLDEQAQQTALVKLTGGGRIGALFNKLIQDSTDTVLRRNLEAALDGRKGLSAIEEQARVTQTLTEQTRILLNSLTKVGTEAADKMLPRLTALTAQLSATLQTPAFRQFVDAAIGAIADLLFGFADLVKFIASLNINWENFITLLKVFVTIKAAQAVGALVARFSLFGTSLKTISDGAAKSAIELDKMERSAKKAGAASATAASAGVKGWLAQVTGLDVLIERQRRVKAATEAQKKAVQELAAAERARAALATQSVVQSTNTGKDSAALKKAQAASAQERAALVAINQKAANEEARLQSERAARVAKADSESAARRLAIEQNYQTRRKAILASGSRAGLKALRDERAAALADEEAHHQRSLRGVQGYYDRRLALQRSASNKEIQQARSLMAAQLVAERKARVQATGSGGAQAGVTAALTAASASVIAAQSKVNALNVAVESAKKSISLIGAAVRGLAGILAVAGRVISGAFFWVTLLYTLIDLTIGFDKLMPAVRRVTDALGLSSKAARDAAAAQREMAEASKKAAEEYDGLVEAYRQKLDPRTGQLDIGKVEADAAILRSSDSVEEQQKALAALADVARGAQAERDKYAKGFVDEFAADVAKIKKEIEGLTAVIRREQANRDRAVSQAGNQQLRDELTAAFNAEIDKSKKKIDELNREIEKFGQKAVQANERGAAAARDLASVGAVIGKAFNDTSFAGLRDAVIPVSEAAKTYQEAQQAYLQAVADAARQADNPDTTLTDALKKSVAEADLALSEANKKLREFVLLQSTSPGLSKEARGSLELLLKVAALPPDRVAAVFAAVSAAPAAVRDATGAPPPIAPTSGSGKFNAKTGGAGGESEAKKIARARLQLAKAELEAENALFQKITETRLETEKTALDNGLVNIRDYYDARQRVQIEALDKEIAILRKEQELISFEEKGAKLQSEKLRFAADRVRVGGEIAVLEAQRDDILNANANELAANLTDFRNKVVSETNKLAAEGVIDSTVASRFSGNLDALLGEYDRFLQQLRTNGQGVLADSLVAGLNVEAFRASLEPLSREIEIVFNRVARSQKQITDAVSRGSLVSTEAAALAVAANREQIPLLEEKLKIMEAELELLLKRPGITRAAVQQEIQSIEELRDKLEDLRNTQNEVAKDINKSLGDSVNGFLDDLTSGTKTFAESAQSFLYNIANTIRKVFIDDLAQRLLRQFGMSGDGGIGGYLSGVLARGPSGQSVASGAVNQATGQAGQIAANQALQTSTTTAATGVTQFAAALTAAIPQIQAAATGAALNPAAGAATDVAAGVVTDSAEALAASAAMAAFTGSLTSGAGLLQALLSGLSATGAGLPAIFTSMSIAAQGAATALAQVAASGTAGAIAGIFHKGGVVTGRPSSMRAVHPSVFAGAPRYHRGTGRAGLAANEVPAILEQGEAVLTERQQGVISAALDAAGNREKPMNIRNVLVTDPDFVPSAMNSAAGERVLMTFIQRNRMSIKSALG